MTHLEYTTEELNSERWIPIEGFEDHYEVSNLGRVKRIKAGGGTRAGRLLKPYYNAYRYLQVGLRNATGKSYLRRVHRLVACAFIEPRAGSHANEVNHKDGNKSNNRVENLEFMTTYENNLHALQNGLMARGKQYSHCKLDSEDVKNIRLFIAQGLTNKTIACKYNVNASQISRIRTNKRRSYVI